MTRKDYELIAKVFRNLSDDFSNGGSDEVSLSLVASELAEQLSAMNPRFDSRRFLDACGVGGLN